MEGVGAGVFISGEEDNKGLKSRVQGTKKIEDI